MRNYIITTICMVVALLLSSTAAFASPKIDPFFFVLEETPEQSYIDAKAVSVGGKQQHLVDAFVKARDLDTAVDLVERCGVVRTIISDDLFTASVCPSDLDELAASESVIFIEAAKPIHMRNDVAMTELNGYEVHQGLDMAEGYTGKDVIIGMVDTGVDLTHDDFLDADGNSRIVFAWDQRSNDGFGPAEINNTYGTECDAAMIAQGACPMIDSDGHGTHIAGTAAGRDETYGGVAPDAKIIAVRYRSELLINGYATPIFSTTICEAAYYVFKKAEAMGLPAVVNLSLGTHIGAHDGTSLFEQCLDALVENSSGRAIAAAAGNEHNPSTMFAGIHAGYDVSGKTASNFRIRSLHESNVFYLDLWQTEGSAISVGLIVRDSTTGAAIGSTPLVVPGSFYDAAFAGGNVTVSIDATQTENALNGKPHVGLTIVIDSKVSNPGIYDFDLVVDGSGSFDAWWYPDRSASVVSFTTLTGNNPDGIPYIPGDDRMGVAIPSTARNVIAVGAYATRTQWDQGGGCCQVPFTLGDILPFSSMGPSADPAFTGQKPEIAAPGAMIASARSRDAASNALQDLSDGAHTLEAGTSMATPFVTGTIALMFDASANFTHNDVKAYILESAYTDEFTGDTPNDTWGYGKLDILAAVQTAVLGGPTGSGNNASLSAPASGSGCTLAPGQELSHHMIPAMLSVLSMLAVIVTARKKKIGRK